MTLVRSFRALRPPAEYAAAVIAPPYDVVDRDEARALAAERPDSFLHVSRPEIDLPDDTDPYADAVYARGAASLARLVTSGILVREQAPGFYIYQMSAAGHVQTGVALTASVQAYLDNSVRRHELTRPDKETDRVRNIDALNAQTGPVLCAYRAQPALREHLGTLSAGTPTLEATGPGGVEHRIWAVTAADDVLALAQQLNALGALYIADGHHRSAAAARVAATRGLADGRSTGASHEYFLAVAFPHDEMRIHDYNRTIRGLNGHDSRQLLAAIGGAFDCQPAAEPVRPARPGEFGMFLDGHWYVLRAREMTGDDPVAALDVSVLQQQLIGPLLGVEAPRTDPRIEFVGGIRGLDALQFRVSSGRADVAFSLYPTSMEQLMAVADASRLMPPKSTWFEPKLADGLLSHVLD